MLDQDFEGPLFKRLRRNDTSAGRGHQGGPVIPKDLRPYLPHLPDPTLAVPAPGVILPALQMVDGAVKGAAAARYHYQSWGATRAPEGRITNIPAIYAEARPGDLFLIERGLRDRDVYRLSLVRRSAPLFDVVDARTGGRAWGLLKEAPAVTSDHEIEVAEVEVQARSTAPFAPFEEDPGYTASVRIARDRAFSRQVLRAYGDRCAMCGGGARRTDGKSELEAAHIIPRGEKGTDDVRNGLALCRLHHWAFDNGVLQIDGTGGISVPAAAALLPENSVLLPLQGRKLILPVNPANAPHADALRWRAERSAEL